MSCQNIIRSDLFSSHWHEFRGSLSLLKKMKSRLLCVIMYILY